MDAEKKPEPIKLESQIELLIDKKISEAKLESEAKRHRLTLQLAGAALALFGVIIPLTLSLRQESRVEDAIAKLSEPRKASLQLFYEGKPLQGSIVKIHHELNPPPSVELKNNGNGPARDLIVKLYVDSKQPLEFYGSGNEGYFSPANYNDELEDYSQAYELSLNRTLLNAGDVLRFSPSFLPSHLDTSTIQLPALLKILSSDQTEVLRTKFALNIVKSDKQ